MIRVVKIKTIQNKDSKLIGRTTKDSTSGYDWFKKAWKLADWVYSKPILLELLGLVSGLCKILKSFLDYFYL